MSPKVKKPKKTQLKTGVNTHFNEQDLFWDTHKKKLLKCLDLYFDAIYPRNVSFEDQRNNDADHSGTIFHE